MWAACVRVVVCKRLTRTLTSLHSGTADDDDASKVMQLGGGEFFSVAHGLEMKIEGFQGVSFFCEG